MDRMTFLSSPRVRDAIGSHQVGKYYGDEEYRAAADAGRLTELDAVMSDQLRTRLDGAAMWFWLAHGARGFAPKDGTIKILGQIGKRATRVRKQADQILARKPVKTGMSRPIRDRMVQRLHLARGSLSSALGVERNQPADVDAKADPDRVQDQKAMEAALDEEGLMAFLHSPVARALTTFGLINKTPLEELMNRMANPDCDTVVLRDLASELADCAKQGVERLQRMRSLMIKPGHSGDHPLNVWLDDILNTYKHFSKTWATIIVSVKPETSGMPEGPAIGFVMAAFEPIRRDIVRQNDEALRNKRPLPFDTMYERQGLDTWSNRIRIANNHRKMQSQGKP